MPTYDYQCNKCGFTFEVQLPIAQREDPIGQPCLSHEAGLDAFVEKCDGVIEKKSTAPGVSYTYGGAKTSDSFKDVLRRIKKSHRHSTINV
jgi:putative FmdB family regulatory protein